MGKIPREERDSRCSSHMTFLCRELGTWLQFLVSDGECHIEGLSNEVVGIRRRRHAVWVGVKFDHGQVL